MISAPFSLALSFAESTSSCLQGSENSQYCAGTAQVLRRYCDYCAGTAQYCAVLCARSGPPRQVGTNLLRIQPVVARVLLDALLERRGSTYAVPSEASPAVPGQVHEERDRAQASIFLLNVGHQGSAIRQRPVRDVDEFEDVRVAVGGELGVLRQRRRRVRPPSLPSLDDLRSAYDGRAGVDELADATGGRPGSDFVLEVAVDGGLSLVAADSAICARLTHW